MDEKLSNELRKSGNLFQKPGGGTLLAASGCARDWPEARGI